jgi:hypothetical protein
MFIPLVTLIVVVVVFLRLRTVENNQANLILNQDILDVPFGSISGTYTNTWVQPSNSRITGYRASSPESITFSDTPGSLNVFVMDEYNTSHTLLMSLSNNTRIPGTVVKGEARFLSSANVPPYYAFTETTLTAFVINSQNTTDDGFIRFLIQYEMNV